MTTAKPAMTDYAYTSAIDLGRAIAAKELSPMDLMRECLVRLDALEPQLNCFMTQTREEALAAARRAEQAGRSNWGQIPINSINQRSVSGRDCKSF